MGWWRLIVFAETAGSLRDREVACSASDRLGSNFESCVWRTVSSQSSHHPQEVLLAQFSLYVHKGGLKPDSLHFFAESARRRHLFLLSLKNPILGLFRIIILALGNLPGKFFWRFFQFLQQNPRWPPKSYGAR